MQEPTGQTQQPSPGARGQAPGGPGAQGGPAAQGGRAPFANDYSTQDRTRLTVPPEFDPLPIWKSDQAKLIAMVKDPNSTLFQKAIACKRLAFIGGREAIPPMIPLLSHPELGCYARFAMEPNPDPSVDEAFRAALGKLKGRPLMGVIHSIGFRKDDKALDVVGKLMNDTDPEIAQAACATVGMIGGLTAARLLQNALNNPKSASFGVAARAALLCAENLMTANAPRALELYRTLSGTTIPEPVRLAALRTLNAADPAPAGAKAYPPPLVEPPATPRGGGPPTAPGGGAPPAAPPGRG
jgi:hypothetical protein